jgi:hypothetical protein
MTDVNHASLTGTDLHEPKGVAAAANGRTYVSDGAGSGSWTRIAGFGQYQDSRTTVGAPAQTIATGVRTKFVCNGSGLIVERLPSDATVPLWDTTNNKHVPIAEFDTYDLRCTFTCQNYAGATPILLVELDIGGGIGVIESQTYALLKGGAAQDMVFTSPVFSGATYFANGGEIYLTYTGTGSCTIFKNSVLAVRTSKSY